MPVTKGPKGVEQEMHKFKHGELHSGSKSGPTVTNPKQAIAIALHEAGMSKPTRVIEWAQWAVDLRLHPSRKRKRTKRKGKLRIGNKSY